MTLLDPRQNRAVTQRREVRQALAMSSTERNFDGTLTWRWTRDESAPGGFRRAIRQPKARDPNAATRDIDGYEDP